MFIGAGLAVVGLLAASQKLHHTGQKRGKVSRRSKGATANAIQNAQLVSIGAGFIVAAGGGKGVPAGFGTMAFLGIGADVNRGQTLTSAALTNGLAAGAGYLITQAIKDSSSELGIKSFTSFMGNFKWGSSFARELENSLGQAPLISSIFSKNVMAVAAGVMAVPIIHAGLQRKFARPMRRGRRGQEVMASFKADNQAGRRGQEAEGSVAGPQKLPVEIRAQGRIRTHTRAVLNGIL
jgi:hypothetical protein